MFDHDAHGIPPETPAQRMASELRAFLTSRGTGPDWAVVTGHPTMEGYVEAVVTLREEGHHGVVRSLLERHGWLVFAFSATPGVLYVWPHPQGLDAPT